MNSFDTWNEEERTDFFFLKKKLYYKSEGLRKYPKTVKVV